MTAWQEDALDTALRLIVHATLIAAALSPFALYLMGWWPK